MAGGLIQLVAYGAQDMFLTAKPQITFFKASYRRHTHFALEAIEQSTTGNTDFGRKVQILISRNADLIGRAYLGVQLPAVTAAGSGCSWVKEVGHMLIKSCEFDIGGQQIDIHYADWLSVWSSLTLPSGQQVGYANMIGNKSSLTGTIGGAHASAANSGVIPAAQLYIPLQFSWNRHSGLYLPLIALMYHEVKVMIEFETFANLIRGTVASTPQLGETSLWVDYVYLDTAERRKFSQFPHEYLIEQLQFQGSESLQGLNNQVKLAFNHPCKELLWFVRRNDVTDSGSNLVMDYTNYTDSTAVGGKNPIANAKLRLNGQDRFAVRDGFYFRYVQQYQHHTNTGAEGLCVYSFALLPEDHQPSGTVNMSRIDNATLNVTLTSAMSGVGCSISVFAVNYNVLRIGSGMGGLSFAS